MLTVQVLTSSALHVTLTQSLMVSHCSCSAVCRWIPVSFRLNTDAELQWTTINDCTPGRYTATQVYEIL